MTSYLTFWRPKSVRQLVVIAFLVVIAPLSVAIFYTLESLNQLTTDNRQITADLVALNRLNQQLQQDLLDLERRGRQYLVVNNQDLLFLFRHEQQTTLSHVDALQPLLANSMISIGSLRDMVTRMNPSFDALFVQHAVFLSSLREQLSQQISHYIDGEIDKIKHKADDVRQSLLLMVFLISAATLVMMLLFAHWIHQPVNKVASVIKRLGSGQLNKPVIISGPQELTILGDELELMRQQLNETEQQKQQFFHHVSHELKTPLASMREGVDLLAEEVLAPLDKRQREIVEIMQQNSFELQRLIENLLDYNQTTDSHVKSEAIQLPTFCQTITKRYKMIIDTKRLILTESIPDIVWHADRHRLGTALDNLFSNAVNYSPVDGQIHLACREVEQLLYIDVANTGEAIPPAEQEHLFEPFYQGAVERVGPIKGSGIGLSLAKSSIEAQGGTLTIVDHPQFAVCFRLICPSIH